MEISADDFFLPSSNLFSFLQEFDHPAVIPAPISKRKKLDHEFELANVNNSNATPFQDLLNNYWNFESQRMENPAAAEEFLGFPAMASAPPSATPSPMRSNQDFATLPDKKRARRDSPEIDGAEPGAGPSQRRLWVKTRSNEWWERYNSPEISEEEFEKAFRMSKGTFEMICEELESVVTKKNTMLRLAIPVRQRVAVCIWRLATGEPLREVSKRFGLGISTCHKLVLEVCSAIRNVLMPKFLQWPNEEKMRDVKKGFEAFSGINEVGGAIYTTHVPIIAPKVSVASYFNKRHTERNQKTSYSITVQGVVDQKGIFTDICVGWPGSMSDDKVLEQSALYQRANRGLLRDVWIVGNSGFPLMDWLLTPYTKQNLTWTQHALNERVGAVQGIAKEAFMRLKARWSCLQRRTEVKLQDLPIVLGACCVLHNICEMRGEGIRSDLRFDLYDDEMVPENPTRSVNAVQARDQIAHKLLHFNQAGTTFL